MDISKACAEQVLLPAIRDASPGDVVLADGFSCRTQIQELNSGSTATPISPSCWLAAHDRRVQRNGIET